ncbi:CIC11C00000005553 [Sungouiella intermedia]|uniref:UDP-N-acetylglucosamine transferase subunit ALG14 n=1 Tax=Sungouiella intermedia TaxID=45354 RepID=A0A1L0DMP4_9ASCO|nr:CIC11C00000005553 [[Candida] intermedia]
MNIETKIAFVTFLVLLPASLLLLRIIALLPSSRRYQKSSLDAKLNEVKGSSIMVLLGSGGHTGEMMRILSPIDLSSCSRTWVVSSGDTTSLLKAKAYEVNIKGEKAQFIELKRARKVGEPLSLSVKSTIMSFISTVQQVWKLAKPDVLLVNGPGTCIPLAYVLFIMKLLGLCNTRIIYIESLARVNNLSLSGRLILPISDRFLVQWRSLAKKYQRVEYYGILI